jgi:NAD(P)H dehydrogenase (quinone)
MKLGITGASGKVGRMAVEHALTLTAPENLVVTTRSPRMLSDFAKCGVTVRHGDFDEPSSLPAAFAGLDRLLIVSASNATGKRHDEHRAAIDAAGTVGVRRIFFTSMPNVQDEAHPSGLIAAEYRDAEGMVRESGLDYTILRVALYTELHAIERVIQFARGTTSLSMNTAEGRCAFISRADVAASAAAALINDAFTGETIDLTGPRLYTFRDVAHGIGRVVDRTLEYHAIGDQDFHAALLADDVPSLLADAISGTGRAIREGYFDVLTDHAAHLLGREPRALEDVLVANQQELRAAFASASA